MAQSPNNPTTIDPADNDAAQPDHPYQPYMDTKPPPNAGLSDANGMPLTEREIESLEKQARAERETTPEPKDFNIAFPDNLPTPPFLHVDGVPNFRDLGGYQCLAPTTVATGGGDASSNTAAAGGKTYVLKRNLLYRCAHPTHLTPQGLTYLTETLNVHDMYDLRSAPEISRLAATVSSSGKAVYPLADPHTGCLLDSLPGLTRHFVPVYQTEDYGPVALARKLQWYTAEQSFDPAHDFAYSEGFVRAYRDIATHGAGAYRVMFRHLLRQPQPPSPLVFHCTAGKDRTGVFGALVMKLVGVDEETICWEYALTEPGLGAWRKEFIERISQTGLGGGGGKAQTQTQNGDAAAAAASSRPAISRDEAARICGSRAGNMRAFLRTVLDGEFGGIHAYLTDRCGLTAEEVQRLRDALIEEVPTQEVLGRVEIEGWTAEGGCVD
ncbi:protein-tyrosine phosphatase [Cladophialophora carrionii]|uniref:Protein-tyrosine phosphatase n=1 Tax=Cladophialophora carrionii TaxID=86049 RepID=A0A1C1D2D9_9EURO|nr:protein-tyrosine phosphatase [Cladophialophora carrionii]